MKPSQKNSLKLSSKQKDMVLNEVAFMVATGNLYQSSPQELKNDNPDPGNPNP